MFRKIIFVGLLTAVFCVPDAPAQKVSAPLTVVTTIFPLYDFARAVGQDKVQVSLLLPPGIEAHSFEPKPSDIIRIAKADVFIYTGNFMEPWVEDVLSGLSTAGLLVVDASSGITLIAGGHDEDAHGGEREGPEPDRVHHHGDVDPHIWLDLGNAQIMVNAIAAALAQKDPVNRDFYLRNAEEYNSRLGDLDRRFREAFASCKQRTIIYGGHFAFGYFVKHYGLGYESPYSGFSPNAEPSPRAIAELIDKMNNSGARCIFYEELLDPKVARVIARETGAGIELLHGAHNISRSELQNGVTFISIMEGNRQRLTDCLSCR